jgi:hypothetical protein
MSYLPQPPRVWSRVQNSCSLITDTNNYELVIDPYTRDVVTSSVFAERIAMLNKGNVLQYKANSSNLTKVQKYTKIAKGQWVNRNTTWATQSTRGYTNPNTTSLKRDGNVNIAIDPITGAIIGPTIAPPTCPQPIIQDNEGLPPSVEGGDANDPDIPPPVEPTPGSDVFPPIIPVTPLEPIVIQDGGNLICSVQENICTGETKSTLSQQLCHPTTDSDVPGTIQYLCWNDGTQTWYPRQRYVMTNSTDKWPINYKFLVSAYIPTTPILDASSNCSTIFLNWTQSIYSCYSITSYEIYINNSFYKSVSPNTLKYDLNLENGIYDIYIIAKCDNIVSNPSNTIIATIQSSITILGFSNIKKTVYQSSGYTTIVIETTIQPSYNVNGVGIASAYICGDSPKINLLIIGGGGGGASGYNNLSAGAGGGSGAINLITDLVISSFTTVNINVGSGGGGRTPPNGGGGNSSGQSGNSSSFSFNSTTFNSTYGMARLGIGSTSVGGGMRGGATNINGLGIYSGYGGSGGGGAYEVGGGNATIAGEGGLGYTSNGNIGSNGSSNPTGGNGGNSALQTITIPSLGTINIGGGGGGGGYYGGKAGNGLGGSGGTSTDSGSTAGENATSYGAGGGGGGAFSFNNTNTGGNGANGVIIIWY